MLSAKDFIFGVVPQQSPAILIKKWSPIVDFLSKETDHNIILRIEKSIPEFEKKLYKGEYDFSYMNPYHYVVANDKQGYLAQVRANKEIIAILVAKSFIDLDPKNLADKKFLFPAPYAFAATLLTKYELKRYYGVDIQKDNPILYVNSHDSVYKGIARNIGDIGGGIERTFNDLNDKKAKQQLHIIYKTKAYPSHPIAFSKKLSAQDSVILKQALLNVPQTLLKDLNIKKLISIDDKEYDVVRDLSKSLKITQ